jgi:hypothetical protein
MTSLTTEQIEALELSPDSSLEEFQFRKIQPHNLEKAWPIIKHTVLESLPARIPNEDSTFQSILNMLQNKGMIAWVISKDQDIYSVITTAVARDFESGSSSLFIYSMYAFETFPLNIWSSCFEKLSIYARSIGASSVTLETTNLEILNLIKRLAPEADTETRLVTMPLAEEVPDGR